jgi:putative ABC transport system ATP-binding protein
MGTPGAPVVELYRVVKHYHGLRPLRVASMAVAEGERVSIGGMDAGAGELFVNLVTGATLPDEGEVRVFGRPTSDITDGEEWLTSLDRFGIVSERAVLLESATLQQNLALPFTLDIEPVPPTVALRVEALAHRCGIDPERWLAVPAGSLPRDVRIRSHLARALAADPRVLILEEPTAGLEDGAVEPLATDVCRASNGSGVAVLALTRHERFARRVAPRNLLLHGATGEMKPLARRWFGW